MLDVHVIVSASTNKRWVIQCLESVSLAAKTAGFPVTVHTVAGVPGDIGKARAAGYALGTGCYVTYVDDDDYVRPTAFAQMQAALAAGVSAVCTPELVERNGHQKLQAGAKRHHLIAYRRELLLDHARWKCCGDVAQMRMIGTDAIDLPEATYVHRIYLNSGARVLRRANPGEYQRAING